MNLRSLKPSILELPPQERLDLILAIRRARRERVQTQSAPKIVKEKKVVAAKTEKAVAKLTTEQLQALIAKLGG